jgi:quercetin dioxygenase-like cupin family protein
VLEGEVVLTLSGEEIVLHPGDAASFHGDVVHGYRNDGAIAARFALTVYEPAAGQLRTTYQAPHRCQGPLAM